MGKKHLGAFVGRDQLKCRWCKMKHNNDGQLYAHEKTCSRKLTNSQIEANIKEANEKKRSEMEDRRRKKNPNWKGKASKQTSEIAPPGVTNDEIRVQHEASTSSSVQIEENDGNNNDPLFLESMHLMKHILEDLIEDAKN